MTDNTMQETMLLNDFRATSRIGQETLLRFAAQMRKRFPPPAAKVIAFPVKKKAAAKECRALAE